MFFTLLVFGAALTLELFGSYISIMGLSKNASYILVGLAITLDFAKIIIATVLYKQWKNLHGFLKYTLIPPLIFLIIFTSSGAYAFLIQEFSKTTTGQEQAQTRIEALEQEKTKLEARKKEIDGQIAKLPPESVVQRRRLTELFAKEIEHINTRTIEMDKDIPELKIKNMADTTQGGTIGSIAKAYGVSAESITKFLVFPLVLVIDPLAIILLTVANFLVEQRKREKKEALNKQLEIEALMAAEAKNKPPAPAPVITKPVEPIIAEPVAPPVIPEPPPIPEPIVAIAPVPVVSPVATPIATIEAPIEIPADPPKEPEQPKTTAWRMPFSNPISWKNTPVAPAIIPLVPVVAQPAIEDVMAELSSLEDTKPLETVVETPIEVIEQAPKPIIENIETIEPEAIEDTQQLIEDLYDEAPEYEVITPVAIKPVEPVVDDTEVEEVQDLKPDFDALEDLASEEEVQMALAEEVYNSFQESPDPSDLIVPEDDMFAEVDEAIEKAKTPEIKVIETPKRTFTFPPKPSSDITEQINDDIFDNYEMTDSEIMQVIGVNEKDKGFDTSKVLEEDLF